MTTTETTVKERPILFSGPMVRAIIEGRKTQTRRIVKPQPSANVVHPLIDGAWEFGRDTFDGYGECVSELTCPYGVPGDRLWVREAFTMIPDYDILDDGAGTKIPCGFKEVYRADDESAASDHGVTWKPSIHMPHGLHRLTLSIIGIRVERLNDITEDDARAEGVASVDVSSERALDEWCRRSTQIAAQRGESRPPTATNVGKFALLWNQINGKAHPWESNPWVWVVSFRPVEV